jgi:hypothetical protein
MSPSVKPSAPAVLREPEHERNLTRVARRLSKGFYRDWVETEFPDVACNLDVDMRCGGSPIRLSTEEAETANPKYDRHWRTLPDVTELSLALWRMP